MGYLSKITKNLDIIIRDKYLNDLAKKILR